MPKELSPGKANTRRYTPEEKAQAVRLVRSSARSSALITERSGASPSSSATASSPCVCG